jgi:DNA-binding LacI/PurR family transcriptional regulator
VPQTSRMPGRDSPPPPRRATLDDVAARAGVSRALVSIVMREAPGASTATRERVFAAATELGYRPDLRARSLASTKSRLIGVLFGTARRFHFELLEGLYAAAEERGYGLILSALTGERGEPQAVNSLHQFRFDALVMLGPATAEPLMAGRMPLVAVGWHVDNPDVDVVRTSDDRGMAMAVDHLVALGHRRIWHVDGGDQLVADARRGGYSRAMRSHRLASHIRVIRGGEDQLDGQLAAQSMLARSALPTAVIAYNDDAAAAAMSVLAQQDIHVPKEISVVGWDDSTLARTPAFDLTSVGQRPQEMARLAIERLVTRIEGGEVADREIILEPHLAVRGSTGPATGDAVP